jgi:hypothetical protein
MAESKTGAKRRVKEHPAYATLRGILHVIDNHKGKPTADMLTTLRQQTLRVFDLIEEGNPIVQRAGFVILALKQSTQSTVKIVNGKRLNRVAIIDHELYSWAIEQVHDIVS